MATRRERCQWCGARLLVPLQAQVASCPNCQAVLQFRLNRDGYFHPRLNGNRYGGSDNIYNNIAAGVPPYNNYGMPIHVPPPSVHAKKRAVLCGVTYKEHSKALKGSVNSVLSMRYLLVEKLGFPNTSVILLTEEEKEPSRIPTKHNIRAALKWLVQGCQPGDSLVFHYSGHGSQVRDRDGDEIDGHDEALCPVDFDTEGKILDDEINATIVRPLPHGATLHAIIDTCFSGTFLDLPYMCRMNRQGYYNWEDQRVLYTANKGTRGGLAISISACDDHQNSADTTAFTGTSIGALTYIFIQTLEQQPRLTYGRLLIAMRNCIYKAQNGEGHSTSPVQEPQLSSSEQFEIYSKPIVL